MLLDRTHDMIGLVFHITSEDMSATIGHKCNGTGDGDPGKKGEREKKMRED